MRPHRWWQNRLVTAGRKIPLLFHDVATHDVVHSIDSQGYCWDLVQVSQQVVATTYFGNDILCFDLDKEKPSELLSHPHSPSIRRRSSEEFSIPPSPTPSPVLASPSRSIPGRVLLRGHTDFINCLRRVSNDRLLSGSSDSTLTLWSISGFRALTVFLPSSTSARRPICDATTFRGTGRIVSAGLDSVLRVWDLEKGRLLGSKRHVFEYDGGPLLRIEACETLGLLFVPQGIVGSEVVGYGLQGETLFQSVRVQIERERLGTPVTVGCVRGSEWQGDGEGLVIVGTDTGSLVAFDLRQPDVELYSVVGAHTKPIYGRIIGVSEVVPWAANVDPERLFVRRRRRGRKDAFLTASNAGSVGVWRTSDGKKMDHIQREGQVFAMCVLSDDALLFGESSTVWQQELKKDSLTRMRYLVDSGLYDLLVRLPPGCSKSGEPWRCWRFLYPQIGDASGMLEFDVEPGDLLPADEDDPRIKEELFIRISLGLTEKIPERLLYDFFRLFRSLRSKERMQIICARVENLVDLRVALALLHRCAAYRESPIVSVSEIRECPFLMALATVLHQKSAILYQNVALFRQLLGCLSSTVLAEFDDRAGSWKDHADLAGAASGHHSFLGVRDWCLRQAFHARASSDSRIISKEGDSFRVDLGVLILRSNFFHLLHSFHGTEVASLDEGILRLEMEGTDLRTLLQVIYGGIPSNCPLISQMRSLQHCSMYREFDLLSVVLESVKNASRRVIKETSEGLASVLRLFDVVDDPSTREELVEEWSWVLGKSVMELHELIDVLPTQDEEETGGED